MKVDQSCPTFLRPHGLYSPWNSPGQNPGVGCCSLLQGIFPTHGSNPGGSNPRLPHCGRILYQLSHKGSPRILKWVAFPFSSGSFRPRNRTGVSHIAGGFFTNWAIGEAQGPWEVLLKYQQGKGKFFSNETVYFGITLDLEKNCKDSPENPCTPFTQFPPVFTSYTRHLSKLRN